MTNEDAISREDTLKEFKRVYFDNATVIRCAELILGSMPPITPSYNSVKTELEPSEDCISREAIMDLIDEMGDDFYSPREAVVSLDYMADAINELPSVTPSYNSIKSELKPCEDCISRIEAIENFASWYGYDYDNQGYYRLLKQMPAVTPEQPFINKSCISEGVCHEDKVNVLEKIRAEIEKLNPVDSGVIYSFGARDMKEEVLGIIYKYKAESKDKK